MKEYLFINIYDWSTADIKGFDVKYGVYSMDGYADLGDSIFAIEKDITINQNEKFFFLPGVTIPRIKLKNLYAQTKSKTVRDIAEATKIIIGKKSNDVFTDHSWKYWIKTEALKSLLTNLHESNPGNKFDTNTYNNMMNLLEVYTEDIVLGGYDLLRLCQMADGADVIGGDDYCQSSKSFHEIASEHIELFKHVKNVTVYDEVTLISIINSDESNTIDEAMYESLKDMFDSSDKDNRVLAMEIMANSNYQESLMYLCFLFKDYSHLISDQKTRNHVNFKSLVNYMGFHSPTYCSMHIDTVIETLMRENAFTKENAIRVLAQFKDEISETGETNHIKVSKITFGEKAMNYLLEKEKEKHEPQPVE